MVANHRVSIEKRQKTARAANNGVIGAEKGANMIRIDETRQNTNDPVASRRHYGVALTEVDGKRFETKGPGHIYKILTLLWLDGHLGEEFEVWDDVSPLGKPGGLAMTGRVRNYANFGSLAHPTFEMSKNQDPDFTPEQRTVAAEAAGVISSSVVVSRGQEAPHVRN